MRVARKQFRAALAPKIPALAALAQRVAATAIYGARAEAAFSPTGYAGRVLTICSLDD